MLKALKKKRPKNKVKNKKIYQVNNLNSKEAKKDIKAREDGVVSSSIKTREQRTRHGDVLNIAINEADIEVKGEKRTNKYHVAAGSVVTKNVPSYALVAGVPAKVIKYRE